MSRTLKGTDLAPAVQREALRRYIHRYTGDHMPDWARRPMPNGKRYPMQFRDDRDWLANTEFPVTKAGKLDRRALFCESSPTWPNGREG